MKRIWRLLIVGAESHWVRQLIKGVLSYCRVHGSWEFHTEDDGSPRSVLRTRQAIRQWKADGIIARILRPDMERLIKDSDLPAVNVSSVYHMDIPTVVPDSFAIGRMGARYLLDNQFQNLAFCARTGELYAQQRCDGFVREVTNAGLGCEVFTDQGSYIEEPEWVKNRRKLDPWLLSLKKPVAIMCVYDQRAQELAGACRRLGLRVPDDVAILGTGNEESLCLMCTPPLSSVDYQNEKIGYEAARLMDRMLHGAKPPSKPILVPPQGVVVRQSSDIIAIDDRETVAAVRFIRDHAHEPVTIKELLAQVPLCRRALEQRFARHLGRTPKDELMRVRLLRARRLLEDVNLPIKTVVKESGFVSHRTFIRFFRHEMGMTPMQYRRNGSVSYYSRIPIAPLKKIMIPKATGPKNWMTVSQMATAVGLCRDRFYTLIRAGTFPPPVYGLRNRRPFYLPEIQAICLTIREQGIGFDGTVVLFNKVRRNEL